MNQVQSAKSRIWLFESRVLKLTQSIDNKTLNLQWEKCIYKAHIEKTLYDTAQYFYWKNLNKLPMGHEKTLFAQDRCFRAQKMPT